MLGFRHNYADYLREEWPLMHAKLTNGKDEVSAFDLALFSDEKGLLGAFQVLKQPGTVFSAISLLWDHSPALVFFPLFLVYDPTAPSRLGLRPSEDDEQPAPATPATATPAAPDGATGKQEPQAPPQPMTVSLWLKTIGMEAYAEAFAANLVDMEALPLLTDADVSSLVGGAIGPKRKILAAIRSLCL